MYAGTGAPEEYAGLRAAGRAVLVTRSDAVPATLRAAAAAAAGAVLLIVVNDGPGKLLEWYGGDDGSDSPVPVVTVTARDGAPLVAAARRAARLGVEGVPNSPYVYDLVDPHPGRIPADLRYRPRASDLATIDSRFGGDRTRPSGEYRWNFRPYRPYAVGYWLKVDMPGTRVDYVSAQPGTSWAESAVTGPELSWVSLGRHPRLPAGQPADGATGSSRSCGPRNGGGFWSSTRYETYIAFNVQPWADGDGEHAGYQTDRRQPAVRGVGERAVAQGGRGLGVDVPGGGAGRRRSPTRSTCGPAATRRSTRTRPAPTPPGRSCRRRSRTPTTST